MRNTANLIGKAIASTCVESIAQANLLVKFICKSLAEAELTSKSCSLSSKITWVPFVAQHMAVPCSTCDRTQKAPAYT